MVSTKSKRLEEEAARLDKEYGYRTGALGSEEIKLDVIPTGILSLDYALGTGGWPRGHIVEVFGPPDIGKSSIVGFNAIRMAQKEGLLCGVVALEPGFDKRWAQKNGVDPEKMIVARPDTGEDAFNILYEWTTGDLMDFVLFDSIGAVLRSTEIERETSSKPAKAALGGASALITWGVKRVLQPAYKNDTTIMFLNQVRDVMNASYPGMLDSPGGHGLKHASSIRVQLKPGRDRYTEKIGDDSVIVGRSIVAEVARNKQAEGTKQRAIFDFYQKETADHPVGVDVTADVIATASKVGVFQKAKGWVSYPAFPGENHNLNGKDAVTKFLAENPKVYDDIRQEVLEAMVANGTR